MKTMPISYGKEWLVVIIYPLYDDNETLECVNVCLTKKRSVIARKEPNRHHNTPIVSFRKKLEKPHEKQNSTWVIGKYTGSSTV